MRRVRPSVLVAVVVLAVSGLWLSVRAATGGGDRSGVATVVPVDRPTVAGGVAPGGRSGTASSGVEDLERSAVGARVAAVRWVAALGELMRSGPIGRADLLGELLTVEAAAETSAELAGERRRFVEWFGADPARAWWIESPLQVSVVDVDDVSAVVDVWSQLLVGVDGGEVQVWWRTQSVSLRWERGGWRVGDVVRVEGPTPTVAPDRLPSAASEFAVVVGWVPAVLAGSSGQGGG